MISPLVKKIIKCANSKKIILKKININIPVKERIGTNFENLHFLVTEDKSIKHFNKILFRFKNKLKKKIVTFPFIYYAMDMKESLVSRIMNKI